MSTTEFHRSPFEQVLNFLPQGHEKAIKQAIFNMVALCFVFLGVGAAMAVYFILQPFIRPLVWAVLIGSVLHPAKKSAANFISESLKTLIEKRIPLVAGLVLIPISTVDRAAGACFTMILSNIKVLAMIGGIGVSVILFYSYVPLNVLFVVKDSADSFFEALNELASYLSLTMLLVTSVSLMVALIWASQPNSGINEIFWKIASHFFWFLLSCYCIRFIGLQSVLIPIVSVGFLASILLVLLKNGFSKESPVQDVTDETKLIEPTEIEEITAKETPDQENVSVLKPIETDNNKESGDVSHIRTPKTSAHRVPSSLNSKKKSQESWSFIYCVAWACLLIQLYRHPSLLHFVPFLALSFLVKKIVCSLYNWQLIRDYLNRVWTIFDWFSERRELLIPPPVYHFSKVVWRIDRTVISTLRSQIDSIVTAGVLSVVLGVGTVVAFVLGVQLYAESVHLVQVTAGLANSTLARYPEAQHILPKGIDSMMEQVVDNAYVYGREGITTMIKSVVKEENANTAQLEAQALELWDRIYQSWLASHGTPAFTSEEKVPASAILSSVGNILENLKKTSDFSSDPHSKRMQKPPLLRRMTEELLNVTFLVDFAKANVGTVMSVVDSLWAIAKANFSIIFNILTTLLTMIAGGGTAILNFVINRIIFLTALFYLLAASGNTYKPVELISSFSPGTGLTLVVAIEEAVNTVCLASLKMAVFYGLWTWLNHTIFQAGLVIMPSVLAAILSAVPVLGHYWAALPAAIELWLVQDRATDALLLVVFQILPIMYVDTSIYGEIKGGGHPYLTGLAIAGGILCFGMEGAIFGPLLLCCLLVAIRIYSSVVAESPINPLRSANQRRLVRLDTVG